MSTQIEFVYGRKVRRDGSTSGKFHRLSSNGQPLCGTPGEFARTLPMQLPPVEVGQYCWHCDAEATKAAKVNDVTGREAVTTG